MSERRRFEQIELGDELPPHTPDVRLERTRAFAETAGMAGSGRFENHERARKQGLPGALVPGIMSQAILAAMIHRWAPGARIRKIDTIFRAPVLADSSPVCKGVVTEVDPSERTVQLDLTVENEAGETRVMGTALVELP